MLLHAVYKSMTKSKILSIIIIVQLVIAFFLGNLLIYNTNIMKRSNYKLSSMISNKTTLQLSDELVNLNMLYTNLNALNQVKSFHKELTGMDNISYYETIRQPIYVNEFKGDETFLYGYEDGIEAKDTNYMNDGKVFSYVKAIITNKNTVENYELSLVKGRVFNNNDYIKSSNDINIIMGYEYSKYYNVGDPLEINYLGKLFSSKIIGFLKQDESVLLNEKHLYLDRYIILPSLECPHDPGGVKEQMFQARHYMHKVNGTVVLNKENDIINFVSDFEQLVFKHGMFGFSILKISNYEIQLLNLASKRSFKLIHFVLELRFPLLQVGTSNQVG